MDARSAATSAPTRDAKAFYQELERNHLVALWNVNKSLLPKEPRSRCVPHLWRWETMLPLVRQAAEMAPLSREAMEYVNLHTGGPLMPIMACWIQLLRAGTRTKAHRQTGSAVYLVFEGRGQSVIDGQRFAWRKGDLFVVPTWAWHEHASAEGEAILFSVRDTPIMQALGLHREQAYPEHDGHQPVTRVFEG